MRECVAPTQAPTPTPTSMMARHTCTTFLSTRGSRVIGCLWPSDAAQSDQIDQPIAHQLFSQPVLSPCTTSFLKPGQSGQSTESPLKPAVPCDQPELGSGLSLVRMGENSGRKLRTRRSMTRYPLVESEKPAELDSTGRKLTDHRRCFLRCTEARPFEAFFSFFCLYSFAYR